MVISRRCLIRSAWGYTRMIQYILGLTMRKSLSTNSHSAIHNLHLRVLDWISWFHPARQADHSRCVSSCDIVIGKARWSPRPKVEWPIELFKRKWRRGLFTKVEETNIVGMYLETQTPYVYVRSKWRERILFMVLGAKFISLTIIAVSSMSVRPKRGRGSRSDTAVDEYRNIF